MLTTSDQLVLVAIVIGMGVVGGLLLHFFCPYRKK